MIITKSVERDFFHDSDQGVGDYSSTSKRADAALPDEKIAIYISSVIADALQLASQKDNDRLSRALAPAVAGIIRREITNSKEEIVQALYPLAGQLVSAYVAETVSGLLNKTDERLRSMFSLSRLMLRFQSIVTGVPYARLRLAFQFGTRLEAVLVVQRGAGMILDEWLPPDLSKTRKGKNSDLVAGMLAAINEFATEALAAENGALRTLDLGGSHVHLRATPAYIVAVKCSGQNGRFLNRYVDNVLQAALSTKGPSYSQLNGVARTIAGRLETKLLNSPFLLEPERRPLAAYALMALFALVALFFGGSTLANKVQSDQLTRQIMEIAASDREIVPSQIQIQALDFGRRVIIRGVFPSKKSAENFAQEVRDTLGENIRIEEQFLVAIPADFLPAAISQTAELLTSIQSLPILRVATIGTDVTSQLLGTVMAPDPFLAASLHRIALGATAPRLSTAAQLSEELVNSSLSSLANYQDPITAKAGTFSKLEFPLRQELSMRVAGLPAQGTNLALPVTMTDNSIKVNIFSSGGSYGAALFENTSGFGGSQGGLIGTGFGALESQAVSSVQSTLANSASAVSNQAVTTAATVTNNAVSAVSNTIDSVSSTATKSLLSRH